MAKRSYGWKPDAPDFRDYAYAPKAPIALPPVVDLRSTGFLSPVEDQGALGSCTGNAIVGGLEFLRNKQGFAFFDLSRLFVYYNERVIEHTVPQDAGAMIRDGVKSVSKQGVCHESLWPYKVTKFKTKPPKGCYADALKFQALVYRRIVGLQDMLTCLAEGYPVVFGFSVYESFESPQVAASGVVPMPSKTERLLGGHAVLAVGYDQSAQRIVVRNSWGAGWGQQGYFTLPYGFITDRNLSDDFWTITQEEA